MKVGKRLEKLYSITEIKGGGNTILKYSTSEQKEKLLEDYLESYPKLYRRYQKQKDIIRTLEGGSLKDWWILHSKYQHDIQSKKREMENLCDIIRKLRLELKLKNEEIESKKKGFKSLIDRNVELQNRIYYEEKVVKNLKSLLKKFESNNGGVKTKNNTSTTTLMNV